MSAAPAKEAPEEVSPGQRLISRFVVFRWENRLRQGFVEVHKLTRWANFLGFLSEDTEVGKTLRR